MDTEELVGEAAEMMDMTADSKITTAIFSYQEGLTSLETPWHQATQAMTQSQSVLNPLLILMTLLTVPNDDKVILFLFPELFACVSDLESELDTSMDEVFRLNSNCSCPFVPAFPLECHMSLYDSIGCIINPLLS
jgi:hypothetical protein